MAEAKEDIQLHRGLKGIYFERSAASFIDGDVGKLLYRGYNIHDLAENSTFEETTYLLLHGSLPTRSQLSEIDETLKSSRQIPDAVYQVIDLVKDAHPMDVLRTGISALSAFDPDVSDNSAEANIRKGARVTSQASTIVAAHHRIRQGLDPVTPDPSLGHAASFLHMLHGEKPTDEDAKLLDVDFILHAEHGTNASAFAARVCASTISDLHSAIVTGVAVLKGPAHGGAAEAAQTMTQAIGSPDNAETYIRDTIKNGGRIMGFGHRVYKAEDPRARHLRERSRDLGEKMGEPEWYQILTRVEEAMAPYRKRGVFVNVDFYAGSIYHLLGIPDDLFIPLFAMGRIPGWTLQVVEQHEKNILIRPLAEYTGPMDLEYVPLDQRG